VSVASPHSPSKNSARVSTPSLTEFLAGLTGVQTASNFVFLLSGVVLAIVALQVQSEVDHPEEEVRTAVEEVALLRCEVDDLRRELKLERRDLDPARA
jgi:hypothetical protein